MIESVIAVVLVVASVALSGCTPNASKVRDLLEDRGYNHVEIDPTNNELLMFHFTAQRAADESCRGTVSYTGEGIDRKAMISATCSRAEPDFEKEVARALKATVPSSSAP